MRQAEETSRNEEYWDDMSGKKLDSGLVELARRE